MILILGVFYLLGISGAVGFIKVLFILLIILLKLLFLLGLVLVEELLLGLLFKGLVLVLFNFCSFLCLAVFF